MISVVVAVALFVSLFTYFRWSKTTEQANGAKQVLREELRWFAASAFPGGETTELDDHYDDGWAHIVADLSFANTSLDDVSATIRGTLEPRGYVEITGSEEYERCRWSYARTMVPNPPMIGNQLEFHFRFGQNGCPTSAGEVHIVLQGNPPIGDGT